MFKPLKLPIVRAIIKTKPFKQSDQTLEKRKNIENILELKEPKGIKGEKILLVDDVYTTGSTLKKCVKLLQTLNPKKIEILVMSKTVKHKFISPN